MLLKVNKAIFSLVKSICVSDGRAKAYLPEENKIQYSVGN